MRVMDAPAIAAPEDARTRIGCVVAIVSMLHEPAKRNTATRTFGGIPVLEATLRRLSHAARVSAAVVLCWDDQLVALEALARGSRERLALREERSSMVRSPLYAGERVRVRGRVREQHCATTRADCAKPLTPALSPEYRGEGVRGSPVFLLGETRIVSKGPRVTIPNLEAIAAARRWADGWRGGLLGTCAFDVGFHGPFVLATARELGADAVLLIDPSAGLLDSHLLNATIEHADAHPETELYFAPAPPGVCGPLLRMSLLERLAVSGQRPGRLLHYSPDVISREPLAGDACVPVPTPVARATHRLTLDSDRQIARISAAIESLNGEFATASAEQLVRRLRDANRSDPLPREVVLELNTSRLARPIFWPGRHLDIQRGALPLALARDLFEQLTALDDTRLTLAGVGDPLLAPNLFEIIDAAKAAGLTVHLETDLLGPDVETVRQLAASAIDVVSVHLPALTEQMYAAVMGVSGYRQVLQNLHYFVEERAARDRGVPVLAPLFTKCRDNLAEMEAWYDQWLRAVGSAVIAGPSDFAGQIPDHAVADMAPPLRRPCARLESRMTILSDGRIVTCEQDVLGRQALGQVGEDLIAAVWQQQFAKVREEHRKGDWQSWALCADCREWNRP